MSELTNLTDRIAHLRDRKAGSHVLSNKQPEKTPKPKKVIKPITSGARNMATDYFMFFVYALLAVSLICQVGLIVWLDL